MTLFLVLKKEWFDMIASGEKKEEYREIKPFWSKRLENRNYDNIIFQLGYSKDAPRMIVGFGGVEKKIPKAEWSGGYSKPCYAIKLGNIKFPQNN